MLLYVCVCLFVVYVLFVFMCMGLCVLRWLRRVVEDQVVPVDVRIPLQGVQRSLSAAAVRVRVYIVI